MVHKVDSRKLPSGMWRVFFKSSEIDLIYHCRAKMKFLWNTRVFFFFLGGFFDGVELLVELIAKQFYFFWIYDFK